MTTMVNADHSEFVDYVCNAMDELELLVSGHKFDRKIPTPARTARAIRAHINALCAMNLETEPEVMDALRKFIASFKRQLRAVRHKRPHTRECADLCGSILKYIKSVEASR